MTEQIIKVRLTCHDEITQVLVQLKSLIATADSRISELRELQGISEPRTHSGTLWDATGEPPKVSITLMPVAGMSRFTDRARRVMQLANQEAQRCNHDHIAPEHLLLALALVKEGAGVAASVLKNRDIDLRGIRREFEKITPPSPDVITMGKLPWTMAVRQIVEFAAE